MPLCSAALVPNVLPRRDEGSGIYISCATVYVTPDTNKEVDCSTGKQHVAKKSELHVVVVCAGLELDRYDFLGQQLSQFKLDLFHI